MTAHDAAGLAEKKSLVVGTQTAGTLVVVVAVVEINLLTRADYLGP